MVYEEPGFKGASVTPPLAPPTPAQMEACERVRQKVLERDRSGMLWLALGTFAALFAWVGFVAGMMRGESLAKAEASRNPSQRLLSAQRQLEILQAERRSEAESQANAEARQDALATEIQEKREEIANLKAAVTAKATGF
jgi:hypothetical protein